MRAGLHGLVGLLVAGGAFAQSAAKPKIAIPAAEAQVGVPQGSANLLSEIITADVQRSGRYEVISGADLATLLGYERMKQLAGCTEESCMAEIGSALGANLILTARVGAIGSLRVLALSLMDVREGKSKGRQTETVSDDEALVPAAHRLVAKLLDLPLPVAANGKRRKVAYGLFAGAGASAIAGACFGILAQSKANDFSQSLNETSASAAQNNAHVADGLYAVSVLGAAVGLVLFATSGSAE